MGISKKLVKGENIIEFTPSEVGTIKFSCSMGMYTGQFKVVDENGNSGSNKQNANVQVQNAVNTTSAANNAGSCGSGGCGCGGGKAKAANAQALVSPAPAKELNGVQVLKTIYTNDLDISPSDFTVKAGRKVRMEIGVQE